MVLTTFPEKEFSTARVLECYRYRWQIELVFKRFKQIAQLGRLPKYDDESAKAWNPERAGARPLPTLGQDTLGPIFTLA